MEFLIHASEERLWYVRNHLLPRLHGIKGMTFVDKQHDGNIKAYINSFLGPSLKGKGDTWHLEDDIYPDRMFVDWATKLENFEGIVCGFSPVGGVLGEVKDPNDIWYSFPCIRIPNAYLKDFMRWLQLSNDPDVVRRKAWGKGIDFLFHKYVVENPIPIYHHYPCMVEHIDDLIGGSLINERPKPIKAYRFEDTEGLLQLKRELKRRRDENI